MFRRGFREVFVGSESAGDYFNIQNVAFFRVCLLCFVLGVFLIERFWIVFSDCLI